MLGVDNRSVQYKHFQMRFMPIGGWGLYTHCPRVLSDDVAIERRPRRGLADGVLTDDFCHFPQVECSVCRPKPVIFRQKVPIW